MATPSHSGASVDRVAVRLPDFYAADPEMWFTIAERSFEAAGVTTEHTRYGYILGALPTQYSMEVRDIIMNPPAATPYQKLKTELIRRLSSSQEQKTRRLLESEEMGDRRPSQFLRHLRNLAGTTVSDNVLKTLWMGRLPASLQLILATMRDAELDRIAEVADAVSETYHGSAKIAVASASAGAAGGKYTWKREVNRGRPSRRDGERGRSPRRSRSGSAARRRLELRGGRCYYHWKFGSQAHICTPPCNWHSSGNAKGSR
ncbi:uncharacterized protein LOC143432446 [Xylocopa sonorina]|uniref:uncharacterized protein LOC143432446 n=1 Tax=Xylocopa sonorina TaxID=1818115 RepID=UPI00403B0B72